MGLASDAQGKVLAASGVVKDSYGVLVTLTVDATGAASAVTVSVHNGDAAGAQVFAATVPAGTVRHFPFPRGLMCKDGIYISLSEGTVSVTYI